MQNNRKIYNMRLITGPCFAVFYIIDRTVTQVNHKTKEIQQGEQQEGKSTERVQNGPESKGQMQGRRQMWRYLKEFAAR